MLAKFSVKKPYTVVVGIILVIALGVISFMNMTTDLLPSMDLPYVMIYTTYTGATPEKVEVDVTRPLESGFSTLTDVKNVSSTSSENLSLVVLEFESGADMNTAMIEINSEVEQLSGGWDDAIGTPVIMKLNPDMLPVTIATVSLDDADLLELSDYVEDELIRKYESVDGVARVSASGILTQQVDITIEQSRIDVINNAILKEVDEELAEVEMELRDAMSQISSGKGQLSRMKKSIYAQIDEAIAAIDQGSQQMPMAIEQLTLQRTELAAQLEGAKAALMQLEALVNLSDEEKAQIEQVAAALSTLEEQRAQLQAQLDAMEDVPADALERQLQEAQAARDEQLALKASQEKYINDLKLLDAESLKQTIAQLEAEIATNEETMTEVRGQLENAILDRDAIQREVTDLEARVGALEVTPSPVPATAKPTGTPEATDAPVNVDDTEAPANTEAVDSTEAPADTEVADSTEAPVNTEAADSTEAPADTEAADSTEVPANTDAVDNTEVPANTDAVDSTEVPANTEAVDSTEAPADTNAPETWEVEPTMEVVQDEALASSGDGENPESDAGEAVSGEGAETNEAAAQSEPEAQSEPSGDDVSSEGEQQAFLLERFFGGVAQAEGESLEELKAMLADAQLRLAVAQESVDTLSARHDNLRETLNDQAASLEEAKDALAVIEEGEIAIQSRIEAAQKQIEICDDRIAELDAEIAQITEAIANGSGREALVAQIAQLDAQINAIKASEAYQAWMMIRDGEGLNAQYAQAQEAVAQLEAAVLGIDEMLGKLNQGILPGGMIEGVTEDTNLAEARQQLMDARSQASSGFGQASSALRDAEKELAEAWKEFTENRDEALENAGIDGIITVETISAILGSQNLDLPAGYVSNADDRYLVSIGREFASLAELKQLKLFSLGLESVDDVRLLDVASVEISDNSADLFTKVNGENGIMLSFEKQSTASTAEVAENITAQSERLMAENPRLHVTEMMNQGDYINLIVSSVLDNLVSGGALAILILLLFLLDWRPTLIVALSIPTSVVVAFVCMYFMDITLNVMSLSGLAIGIGMLVDNSIVAIENIYRMRDEEGLPILTASIRGVNQVAGALFSSTLTTICVFLPVVFIKGMARDLFSDMGLTIAFSLLASLVVSMTVVPSFAAGLFKKVKPRKHRIFGAIQKGYVALLKGALKVKILVILVSVGLLAFTVHEVMDMPISFMPSVNSEQMSASLTFEDEEIPDSERESIAIEIMDSMLEIEGVSDISLSAADSTSLLSGGAGYTYYILVDPGVRTNGEIAQDMQSIAAQWADGENVIFGVQVSTMDLSAFAGSGITINIAGEDIDDMRRTAREVAALCAQVPGAENIDDGAATAEPKLVVTVDKELASDNSLSVAQVYQYVAQRLCGPIELTEAKLDGREYTIYVSEDKNEDLKPEDIENMEIEVEGTEETYFVRIGDIADISYGESFASISRDNQKRVTSVSFSIAEGYSANLVSRDLEALLDTYQPVEGCEISLAGENESVMSYMEDLVLMLLVAVLFIFLIMVAQFQSFKSPFIVMFTIPLAFTGGLLALIITKMDLSIIAMVGFLVLSGVVVNNGIVFVDSINQLRIGGMEKKEAIVETGRIRLRPILMTALTTILGMSTMALATGMGAEMMQPMAVVIVGGLAYSTLMTLFVVPVLYDMFNGKKMKAREIEMMKEAAGMSREGFDEDKAEKVPAAPVAAAPVQPAPVAGEDAAATIQKPGEAEAKTNRSKRIKIRF